VLITPDAFDLINKLAAQLLLSLNYATILVKAMKGTTARWIKA
jgi:hypothetical protein